VICADGLHCRRIYLFEQFLDIVQFECLAAEALKQLQGL